MEVLIFSIIVLIFSAVIHEVSHGSVANMLGDPTAKNAGRLTLNPISHLDPVGSLLVPLFLAVISQGRGPIFGWAKPVPVNSHNFRNPRWDGAKVAFAGAGANLLLALAFGLALRFLPIPTIFSLLFSIIVLINLLLGIFNLVPIPPLDGSHILFAVVPDRFWRFKVFLEQYGMFILLFVFMFFGLRFISPLISFSYELIVGYPLVF